MAADQRRTLTSGKVVGNRKNRQEWMVRRRNKYKRDKFGRIEGEIEYRDENTFEMLREEKEEGEVNRACNLIHSPKEITLEKQETETRDGGNGETQEDKRAIVVYSTDNKEILPLTI
ncbi:hypothetical protein R3W88_001251 [Solanum pinnatisectum]|uniref:Uncharacterized protein n=1 Tax=Solanum pinnatisectum TaxID=50273 RepID=A0AAV9MKK7_9SOLN|nr:hypothetical protein R3W88_001251 [Solanum pinnatisectum]